MLKFRHANSNDADILFKWTNDPIVRINSFTNETILYSDHIKWFNKRIKDPKTFIYIFQNEKNQLVGQVRIEMKDSENVIGISIDEEHRGKGYGTEMLIQSCMDFKSKFPKEHITAYIKSNNTTSLSIFKKAGFEEQLQVNVQGSPSYKLILK